MEQVVELAYQRTKKYDKLMMLYAVTGDIQKLNKLVSFLESQNLNALQYQAALLMSDKDAQLKLFQNNLKLPLAVRHC